MIFVALTDCGYNVLFIFILGMSQAKIFTIYVLLDLAIAAGVVWCAFQRMPVARYLIPAAILFVLSGVWLVVMTVRNTPSGTGR